jgi:amino acid transporter
MVIVNIRDAGKSVRFMQWVTIIKLLPLFGIIIFGFRYIEPGNIKLEHFPSLSAFNNTALILFFVLAGFETSLNVSGEIKNPKRTVPRGILLGGISVLLIYMLIQTVTQGVLGTHLNQFKDAPLAEVAKKIAGTTGVTILIFAAAFSGAGAINGDVLASPRLLFAGAKDGLFPKYLAKIHPRFLTPYLAVITYAAAIFIFSVSGGFKQLAILASGALLLIYLAVVLAMLKLRMRKLDSTEKLFRVPGGLLIPIIAITAIVYVLSNLSRGEIVSILLFVVLVSMIYFVMKMLERNSAYNSIKWKQEDKDTIKAAAINIKPSDEI